VKKHKNDICAYCGSPDDLNKDHVPPKNLFPKPRPNNLIKVPACPICHSRQTSKDDQYFCLKILMREGVQSNPAAKNAWNTVLR
jgi:5-methylcytosine-specific restriction endonuclease McrA